MGKINGDSDEIVDYIREIIGAAQPTGDPDIDQYLIENFDKLLYVTNELVNEVVKAGRDKSQYPLTKQRRKKARRALAAMHLDVGEYLDVTYPDYLNW